jgi:hypothetical protein
MPRSVLVSAIMAGARRRADDDVDKALTQDDPELISYIDQAYGAYYDVLVSADPEYYQVETSFSTVAGTKLYALPTNWSGTKHVDRLEGQRYIELGRLQPHERNYYAEPGLPCRYRVEQGQLALYRTPSSVITIRHTYVPVWTALTADTQTIDGLLGNEDLIEIEVAIRLLEKEDIDVSGLVAKRSAALERLQARAFQHNVIDAQVVGLGNIDAGGVLEEGDWPGRRWR